MSADRLPILQFFHFDHLPTHLQRVSQPFADLAEKVAELPRNAENSTALRKLLEAKDAAVRAIVAVALLCCLLPSVALAADGSFIGGLVGGLLTAENIGIAVAAILTVAGAWFARLVSTEKRRRNVAIGIRTAFVAVEEFARLSQAPIADKASAGLAELDKWLLAQGWRKATEREKELAKLEFSAISGQQHLAIKTATTAAQAARAGGAAAVPTAPLARS